MSVNALEAALWQLYLHPADVESFRSDSSSYAAGYRLTEAEREILVSIDVMGLINYGVNTLLVLMAFQTIYGPERLHDYFDIVNASVA